MGFRSLGFERRKTLKRHEDPQMARASDLQKEALEVRLYVLQPLRCGLGLTGLTSSLHGSFWLDPNHSSNPIRNYNGVGIRPGNSAPKPQLEITGVSLRV